MCRQFFAFDFKRNRLLALDRAPLEMESPSTQVILEVRHVLLNLPFLCSGMIFTDIPMSARPQSL